MLVLLDRDGVINADRPDSVTHPDQLLLIDGSGAAVAALNRAGMKVAVVTNQSVVGRGIISTAQLDAIHHHLQILLANHGAQIDAIYACHDAPDAPTPRRKPGAAMLQEALRDFGADAAHTPFIGDALTDLQAAAGAGCGRLLVKTGKGAATLATGWDRALDPVMVYDDLAQAVAALLENAR